LGRSKQRQHHWWTGFMRVSAGQITTPATLPWTGHWERKRITLSVTCSHNLPIYTQMTLGTLTLESCHQAQVKNQQS
jgi:hypothetical protein